MASVQLVMGCAFSIVPPVLPLLLPTLGVDTPQSQRIWAGMVLGVTPLAAAITSTWWGRLTNRIDARWIILVSCGTAAVCTACMSLANQPLQLLALRFAMGLFGGHIAASMAIVSRAAPGERLGYALGWIAAAQLSGTLLGPLLGGAIADAFRNLRAPFVAAGFAILLVVAFVARVPPQRSSPTPADHTHALRIVGAGRELGTLLVTLLMAQCAIMSLQPIISLHVHELTGPRPDLATLSGLAFSALGLGGLLAAPVLGRLSDAIGARRVLLVAMTAAALFTATQALAPTYSWFIATRLVAGVFVAGIIPTINTLVGRRVPAADRGQAYGLTASATFFGAFVGPTGGGVLSAHLGLSSVFICSAMILALAAVWIHARLPRDPPI